MHPEPTEGVVAEAWKFFDRLNAGDVVDPVHR
jgi:hypothetical protein